MSKSIFELATKHTNKNGRFQIKCIKGLWGVDAPTKPQAIAEAMHYFMQYYSDGEYSDIECVARTK